MIDLNKVNAMISLRAGWLTLVYGSEGAMVNLNSAHGDDADFARDLAKVTALFARMKTDLQALLIGAIEGERV